MKKVFLFLSSLTIMALACDVAVNIVPPTNPAPQPTNTLIPASAIPTQIPASATPAPSPTLTAAPPPSNGTQASFGSLSLVIPQGLAGGLSGSQIPRKAGNDAASWELDPGHTQIDLDGYILQGKFHKPQIFIYPGLEYAQLVPAAFESIHRLDNILGIPGAAISSKQLPAVPFFNAAQVFASNIQIITFQSGRGVRFLTEYGQYPASANNHDLFYEFQGLTSDGTYYIIAILPVTIPMLGESSDPASAVPVGGVAYPGMGASSADWDAYYNAVTLQLNAQAPASFIPTLNQLDLLIQSIKIAQ
jgi:hypothetical protein